MWSYSAAHVIYASCSNYRKENVTFTAGNTIESFDILINDDGVLEGTETFTLLISQFTSNLTVGTSNESTVHIINTNSKLLLYVCTYVH